MKKRELEPATAVRVVKMKVKEEGISVEVSFPEITKHGLEAQRVFLKKPCFEDVDRKFHDFLTVPLEFELVSGW